MRDHLIHRAAKLLLRLLGADTSTYDEGWKRFLQLTPEQRRAELDDAIAKYREGTQTRREP